MRAVRDGAVTIYRITTYVLSLHGDLMRDVLGDAITVHGITTSGICIQNSAGRVLWPALQILVCLPIFPAAGPCQLILG